MQWFCSGSADDRQTDGIVIDERPYTAAAAPSPPPTRRCLLSDPTSSVTAVVEMERLTEDEMGAEFCPDLFMVWCVCVNLHFSCIFVDVIFRGMLLELDVGGGG